MSPPVVVAAAVVVAVLATMALEARLSAHNERGLRARGAVEPPDDVIGWMRAAYPLGFVAIGVAGATNAVLDRAWLAWGGALFGAAKALKFWAMATLGPRWTFRVLVPPGDPMVTRGPYRYVRHPNYLGVLGEFAGVAIALGAPIVGAAVTAGFGYLILRRLRVEETALGISR
jgi:methyltransferase